MRHSKRAVLVVLCAVLSAPLAFRGTEAVAARSHSGPARAPSVESPKVVAAALEADGTVVRRAAGLLVEEVDVPARLRVETPVYRVRVEGRFPPRALRYVVTAGDRPIAYGVPAANQRALVAVTTDAAVLTAPVTARYEGGASAPALEGPPAAVRKAPSQETTVLGGVTRTVYDFGDEVFQPTDLGAKVELTANVHYPTGLPGGPYPLVLFMHGNHVSCFRENRISYRWPCGSRSEPLPNYIGYDYIARRLAGNGYIVVSVSANGVNVLGNNVEDTGMRQRGEVLEKHIDLWREWSTVGAEPFGETFVGKVDLSRIGTMGHSRGGEGVVWNKIVDEERPDPYGIDAVLALAPVDFTRVTINEAAFSVLLPTCDGDVYDLQGVHFFDDSRYMVPGDPTPKHTVTVFGANHNFFNTVWSPGRGYPGGFDDGRFSDCGERLGQFEQRQAGRLFIVSFFRRYLGEETALDPIWTGERDPVSLEPGTSMVNYLAPDTPEQRMDVVRYTDSGDLTTNQTGGAAIATNMTLYGWCANTFDTPCMPGQFTFLDRNMPGLAEGMLGWSDHSARLRFELAPGSRDVSDFDALQFRTVLNPGYEVNLGVKYQDLAVALVDGDGTAVAVPASEVGNEALKFPLRRVRRRFAGHILMQQVRFPLERFEGVDLSDVRAVEFRFTRMRAGVINVADVAFSAGAD
jgi:hypothetical protein